MANLIHWLAIRVRSQPLYPAKTHGYPAFFA